MDVLIKQNSWTVSIECKIESRKSVISNIVKELTKIVEWLGILFFVQSAIVIPYPKSKVSLDFLEKVERVKIKVWGLKNFDRLKKHVEQWLGM